MNTSTRVREREGDGRGGEGGEGRSTCHRVQKLALMLLSEVITSRELWLFKAGYDRKVFFRHFPYF